MCRTLLHLKDNLGEGMSLTLLKARVVPSLPQQMSSSPLGVVAPPQRIANGGKVSSDCSLHDFLTFHHYPQCKSLIFFSLLLKSYYLRMCILTSCQASQSSTRELISISDTTKCIIKNEHSQEEKTFLHD